jgi:hypothetical protein
MPILGCIQYYGSSAFFSLSHRKTCMKSNHDVVCL